MVHPAQWKRRMAYLAVRAALDRGATLGALPVPVGKWLVVDGRVPSREEFIDRVRAKLGLDKFFEERRWFLDDGELFHDATTAFALSNQWSGPDVLSMVDQIAEAHPGLRISYEPRAT